MIYLWLTVYILIGILLGGSTEVKGGGKPGLSAYIICALVWPLILLIALVEEIDRIKRGGR
jgi:membrane protein DedA with SNARE-associated domain